MKSSLKKMAFPFFPKKLFTTSYKQFSPEFTAEGLQAVYDILRGA